MSDQQLTVAAPGRRRLGFLALASTTLILTCVTVAQAARTLSASEHQGVGRSHEKGAGGRHA
jgi:hypothetical protein